MNTKLQSVTSKTPARNVAPRSMLSQACLGERASSEDQTESAKWGLRPRADLTREASASMVCEQILTWIRTCLPQLQKHAQKTDKREC